MPFTMKTGDRRWAMGSDTIFIRGGGKSPCHEGLYL